MLTAAWSIAVTMLVAAVLLNLIRLWRGPDALDRATALDTTYINAVALLVLLGWREQTSLYFEAAMLIALMGFVGTVAFGKYLLRDDVIE